MAKRPDSFETTVLAIELLRRLPRSYKVTARELRDQLELADIKRDLRTIQRQLELLSRHFGEIERDDRSKPYGYRWKEKARGLVLPVLSEQESLLLALAEQHLGNLLPAKLMKSMEGIFSQARTRLSARCKNGIGCPRYGWSALRNRCCHQKSQQVCWKR